MARAMWTGLITFGLVSVPVGLFAATEDHTVRFHQLQRGTTDRIRNRRVNERTGEEVSSEDIVKGYELDEIAPGRSQTIEISDFVGLSDIEPVKLPAHLLRRAPRQGVRQGLRTAALGAGGCGRVGQRVGLRLGTTGAVALGFNPRDEGGRPLG